MSDPASVPTEPTPVPDENPDAYATDDGSTSNGGQ